MYTCLNTQLSNALCTACNMDKIHEIHIALFPPSEGQLQNLSVLQTAFYKIAPPKHKEWTYLPKTKPRGFPQSHRKLIHDEYCSCKPPLHCLGWWRWREVRLESPWILSKFTILRSIKIRTILTQVKNQLYLHWDVKRCCFYRGTRLASLTISSIISAASNSIPPVPNMLSAVVFWMCTKKQPDTYHSNISTTQLANPPT